MANSDDTKIAVVMVPLPAQGHLNQLLQLSRRISSAGAVIYYVGAATHIRQAKLRVHGWDPSAIPEVHFHEFPMPHSENPLPDPGTRTKFPSQLLPLFTATLSLRYPVRSFVEQLSRKFRRVVVIHDSLMSYVVQDIDSVRNAECYRFRSISAFAVYSYYWDWAGRQEAPPGAEILKEIPRMEECLPPEFLEFTAIQSGSWKVSSGEIFNSNRVIEGFYLDLYAKQKATGSAQQWAIGPFNPVAMENQKTSSTTGIKCLDWLDKHGSSSVLFISFGTTSSFSDEQIQELAIGLERSQQKFIWVLRDADKGDIFTGEIRKPVLPTGFEDRVKARGLVVRDWAPQLAILCHPSTGGFMSHCGWNSCMESISSGVPIATWPMHSDQPMNAVLVREVLRIGVEVKDWNKRDEVVSAVTVEHAVRKLMASEAGDLVRKRAQELGDAVRNSVMEGGSSSKEMDSFIAHITR